MVQIANHAILFVSLVCILGEYTNQLAISSSCDAFASLIGGAENYLLPPRGGHERSLPYTTPLRWSETVLVVVELLEKNSE